MTKPDKEKLAALLAAELAKDRLENKVPMSTLRTGGADATFSGTGTARYRPMSLSTAAASRGVGGAAAKKAAPAPEATLPAPVVKAAPQPEVDEFSQVNTGPIAAAVSIRANSDWATLTKFAGAKAKQDAVVRKELLGTLKEKQRAALLAQTSEHDEARRRALEEKVADKIRIEADVFAYEGMERRKMELRAQRELEVRQERERQLLDIMARRMDAEAVKKAEEVKLMEDLAAREAQEKAEAARKKILQKAKYDETMRDNDAKIAMKAQQAEKDRLEDVRLQNEYKEMLEMQEKRRRDQLEQLYSKSAARAAVAGEEVVKQAAFKEKEFEFRLAAAQKAKEASDAARLARETAKRNERTSEQLAWLAKQVADKEEKKRLQVQEMRDYTANVVQQAVAAKGDDELKKLARKERDLRHQAFLAEQVQEKEARRPKDWVMNESERKINTQLLGIAQSSLASY